MLSRVASALASTYLRVWFSNSQASWRTMPRPTDSPIVHAAGVDSDRLLLAGAGLAVGYGVMSHDLAFAGSLARRISAITGRGTDIDIVSAPDMTVAGVRAAVSRADLARFDSIVLTIGAVEALELMSRRLWRKQLRELFDAISVNAPVSVEVFIVGIPLLSTLLPLPFILRRLADAQTVALNEESIRLCSERGQFTFVEFDPRSGDFEAKVGRSLYDGWAAIVATPIAAALDFQAPAAAQAIDEAGRQRALEALGILDTQPDPRFDLVVSNARDLFEAAGASITFIDGERQWDKAATGESSTEFPSRDSLAAVTILRPRVFVVPDVLADPRFRDKEWANRKGAIRFYAGYPIEAPDGHRVGALCVVDTKPRRFSDREAALLRQLALRVQGLLRGVHH